MSVEHITVCLASLLPYVCRAYYRMSVKPITISLPDIRRYPGQNKLVIDPEQATRFALDDNGGVEFTLEDDTAILPGVELHLTALNAVTVD